MAMSWGDGSASRSVRVGPGAPADARRFIRGQLGQQPRLDMALVDEAELLVSEVVTVATLHSGSDEANVAVSTENGCVRIEVTDAHRGFALEPEDAALGLRIVDRVAPRWGVDLTKPGKTVWFELELPIALDAA